MRAPEFPTTHGPAPRPAALDQRRTWPATVGGDAAWPGALVGSRPAQLFLTSFLALYAELLCIRWMPAHIRYLGYFTNFVLLASFLGLGVGILSARGARLPLRGAVFPWLMLAIAVLVAVTRFEIQIGAQGVLYYGAGERGAFPRENVVALPVGFLLVTLLFVAIGRSLGGLIAEVTPPLRAYGWDVAGSLAGIVAFFVLSLLQTPPAVWFAGLVVLTLLLSGPTWPRRALMLAPLLTAGIIAMIIGAGFRWSPYYKIGLEPEPLGRGYVINVNDAGHQTMLPPEQKEAFYRAPYEIFGHDSFRRALIIGAGSGSDTAVALAYGVDEIDAVEIDPVIADIGTELHPSQPFRDPRVTVHIDDGRKFLSRGDQRYDLIVFALPDSLTLTSQFASLRLESFLFTNEAFADARRRLTDDGAIVLYNYYREPWLLRKLAAMLESTFGAPPYVESYGGWGRAGVLVAGPRLERVLSERPWMAEPYRELRAPTPQLDEDPDAIILPRVSAGILDAANPAGDPDPRPPTPATDDWPLLYLRHPSVPTVFLAGLGMIAVVTLGLLFGLLPRRVRQGFDGHMFSLGAAFMLLETRSLVTFSLLFGSTWLVNSLVFFAILSSVMIAVVVSARFRIRPSPLLYALLVASLAVAYALPTSRYLAVDSALLRYALASVVTFLPIFVANLIFAASFKQTGPRADRAFASNLLGIMVGGMLEYSALLIGYRHLIALVALFYLVAAGLAHGRPLPKPAVLRRRAASLT